MVITQQNSIHFIDFEQIIYLKSDNSYTSLFIRGGKTIMVSKSLAKFQKELESKHFIRVNQSYLVNKNHIESVDKRNKFIALYEDHSVHFTITLKKLMGLIG